MKKIIAPIVYLLFIVPVFILTLNAWGWYEGIFGWQSFGGRQGVLDGSIIFLLVSAGTFYFGNFVIQKIDRRKQPSINNHFRQSALLYILFIWLSIQLLLSWPKPCPISMCQTDNHGYAIGVLFVLIPLLGIIINALYLFRRHKVNAT